jgi:hypothetical protein
LRKTRRNVKLHPHRFVIATTKESFYWF